MELSKVRNQQKVNKMGIQYKKITEKAENTANVMKNVIIKFQSNPLTQFQDTSAQNFNQNL